MRFSIVFALLVSSVFAMAETVDSLRTEKRGDQWVVIHRVDQGETLYGIARRYQADVNKVIKQNSIVNNNIQIGQVLEIPITLKEKSPATVPVKTPVNTPNNKITTHTVAAGETLFAIARKYSVKVDDIVAWNKLSSESLNVGQVLSINGSINQSGYTQTPYVKEPTPVNTPVTTPTNDRLNEAATSKEVFGKKVEEGVAMQIDDMGENEKYLALHKTLPIGTLVEVRNLMNNKKVYVRVVGQLPQTGNNENVIIRLTPKSFQRLGILDLRARVELTYYEE